MEPEERKAHVFVVPYPTQGHINPMLQFSKRLVAKGLKVTLAMTVHNSKIMKANPLGSIKLEKFSDGFDEGGYEQAESVQAYLESLKTVGLKTLSDIIKKLETNREPVSCVVYDSFLPWALDMAKELSLMGASFFTQSCAVNSIYYHIHRGLFKVPIEDDQEVDVSIPWLPKLEMSDFPSFISVYGSYPDFFNLVLNQFSNLDKADWILVNTFQELEPEGVNWMSKLWPTKTIGPTLPSMYLDARVEGDTDYSLHLFVPDRDVCINWLNTKETASVVYVSLGSLAILSVEQTEELARGLRGSNNNFLWVVRTSEMNKLPDKFIEETSDKGLVVTWCPQLEVLSHKALGCFLTHCGWNSTLEALSFGVPMATLPQWTDQPTNAKFVEDEWKMGLRIRVDRDKGIPTRTEIEACIREIMQGEQGKEIKRNARKWNELAKTAVDEGGSSDINIQEIASTITMRTINHRGGVKCD